MARMFSLASYIPFKKILINNTCQLLLLLLLLFVVVVVVNVQYSPVLNITGLKKKIRNVVYFYHISLLPIK